MARIGNPGRARAIDAAGYRTVRKLEKAGVAFVLAELEPLAYDHPQERFLPSPRGTRRVEVLTVAKRPRTGRQWIAWGQGLAAALVMAIFYVFLIGYDGTLNAARLLFTGGTR